MAYSRFLFWFTLFFMIFISCTPSENEDSSKGLGIDEYKERLAKLNSEAPASSGEALTIFENEFDKKDPIQNDLAIKAFIDFQEKLIENLNNSLYQDDNLSIELLNIAYGEESKSTQTAIEFNHKLVTNGMMVSSTEGSAYIESNTEVINSVFLKHLTKPAQGYYQLIEIETLRPLAEDGGIIIPIQELAERMLAWEKLSTEYPESNYSKEAEDAYNSYLFWIMAGMDNTPPYDYETEELDSEHLGAYQFILEKHPDSKSSEAIKPLMEMLTNSNFKRTDESSTYIRKFSIWD